MSSILFGADSRLQRSNIADTAIADNMSSPRWTGFRLARCTLFASETCGKPSKLSVLYRHRCASYAYFRPTSLLDAYQRRTIRTRFPNNSRREVSRAPMGRHTHTYTRTHVGLGSTLAESPGWLSCNASIYLSTLPPSCLCSYLCVTCELSFALSARFSAHFPSNSRRQRSNQTRVSIRSLKESLHQCRRNSASDCFVSSVRDSESPLRPDPI